MSLSISSLAGLREEAYDLPTILSTRLLTLVLPIRILTLVSVSLAVKAHAIGAGDRKFDSRAGQIGKVLPTIRHRCNVFWSCVAQTLSSGNRPRRSLKASANTARV